MLADPTAWPRRPGDPSASRHQTAASACRLDMGASPTRLSLALSRSPRCRVIAEACSQSPHASDKPGNPMRAPVCGQPVKKTVGRRVVTLPRARRRCRPSTKTSQTPTNPDPGSAHASSRPHPPWPATPHPSAPVVNDAINRIIQHPRGMNTRRAADIASANLASNLATASRSATSQATTDTCAPASLQIGHQLRDTLGSVTTATGQHHMTPPHTGPPHDEPAPRPPSRCHR